jgi:indole-3-glycerol phosphate synthase
VNVLDRITAYKLEFVAEAKRQRPMKDVMKAAEAAAPTRGFARALRGTRTAGGAREPQSTLRVTAEIKKASPSKGVIRADLDPAEIARSYEAGGAAAISVLTDEKFFQGSLANLQSARAATSLPILRKEFILDEYQIVEARAAGADAILLIAGSIDWPALGRLRERAGELDLDVLMEIHNEGELAPALELAPDILGINNRDLRDENFKTDLARTEALIGSVPVEWTLMSESGIGDRRDVERLARAGVDAILVGERLMQEPDPGSAIGEKLGLGRASAPPAPPQ